MPKKKEPELAPEEQFKQFQEAAKEHGVEKRLPDWWMAQEIVGNGSFVTEYTYADLVHEVRNQGDLFDGFLPDIEEHDAECGLICAA